MSDYDFLKRQGFYLLKKMNDGTFIGEYNKTTYYGLYVDNGVVRQK